MYGIKRLKVLFFSNDPEISCVIPCRSSKFHTYICQRQKLYSPILGVFGGHQWESQESYECLDNIPAVPEPDNRATFLVRGTHGIYIERAL